VPRPAEFVLNIYEYEKLVYLHRITDGLTICQSFGKDLGRFTLANFMIKRYLMAHWLTGS
jgi:hypothetical protein